MERSMKARCIHDGIFLLYSRLGKDSVSSFNLFGLAVVVVVVVMCAAYRKKRVLAKWLSQLFRLSFVYYLSSVWGSWENGGRTGGSVDPTGSHDSGRERP